MPAKKPKVSKRNAPAYRAMLSASIAKDAIETHCGRDGRTWQDWAAYNLASALEDIAEALMVLLEEKDGKA
jgi:hypothetical protein